MKKEKKSFLEVTTAGFHIFSMNKDQFCIYHFSPNPFSFYLNRKKIIQYKYSKLTRLTKLTNSINFSIIQ